MNWGAVDTGSGFKKDVGHSKIGLKEKLASILERRAVEDKDGLRWKE